VGVPLREAPALAEGASRQLVDAVERRERSASTAPECGLRTYAMPVRTLAIPWSTTCLRSSSRSRRARGHGAAARRRTPSARRSGAPRRGRRSRQPPRDARAAAPVGGADA
jgi:hypothetical protein